VIDVKAYASSASRILFTTLLGKILGFLKIVLLIRLYGVGPLSDSIIVVISIYWFWSSVLVYSLFSISLIPKLGKARSQQRQLAVTLKTLHAVNVLACIFIAIVGANTEGVLSLFSPVPDPIFIHYSKLLLTSLLPLLFLMPLTEIFTILNQYNDRMVTASSNLSVWNFFTDRRTVFRRLFDDGSFHFSYAVRTPNCRRIRDYWLCSDVSLRIFSVISNLGAFWCFFWEGKIAI